MRIAYVVERDVSRDDAVVKKVVGQANCWCRLGHDTSVFALSSGSGVASALAELQVVVEPWRRWRDWLSGYRRIVDHVIAWEPDIVYFRFSTYFPTLGRLLRCLPTVTEINTDDLTEYRTTMTRKAFAYHCLTRSRLLRHSAGLIVVTNELADRFRREGRPLTVVANGIELGKAPAFPAPCNDRPQLLFLGQNRMPWHGIDHIVQLALACPEWRFDVVGDASFGVASSPPNVRFQSFTSAAAYRNLLAKADVALGTLALYRKSMSESCALKVREYLASGVPTIIAGRDTDFPQEVPFLLQLPNTPDNVRRSLEHIRHFVKRSLGTRVPREAIGHLDLSNKEAERLAFFARVLGQQETVGGTALLDT